VEILKYVAGFLSGIMASMGLGGGSVLIIYLTAFAKMIPTEAAITNLLFFIPTAVIAVILNAKNKKVNFKIGWMIVLGGVLGALLGAFLGSVFGENEIMYKIFAGLLLIMGIKDLFFTKKAPSK
jgi:uncharacterized membrane protein YfcA